MFDLGSQSFSVGLFFVARIANIFFKNRSPLISTTHRATKPQSTKLPVPAHRTNTATKYESADLLHHTEYKNRNYKLIQYVCHDVVAVVLVP